MFRKHQKPPDVPAQQRANELVRLIRKLRWMGVEEEVTKAQAELAHCDIEPTDSVLATSRETD